jgi:hypothetical protein
LLSCCRPKDVDGRDKPGHDELDKSYYLLSPSLGSSRSIT